MQMVVKVSLVRATCKHSQRAVTVEMLDKGLHYKCSSYKYELCIWYFPKISRICRRNSTMQTKFYFLFHGCFQTFRL